MGDDNRIAGKIKSQITQFACRISNDFKKPMKKFMVQMLYGIQASKDVKLSYVARSLNEEIALIKTENRLSRHMGEEELTESINEQLIEEGAKRIQEDTVIALDISDIDKPYAKKMEHLALVRDGSTGEKRSSGYWLISVLGADVEGEDLTPLSGELYSQKAEGFRSENRQILDTVDRVKGGIGKKGIWAVDRGGDRSILPSRRRPPPGLKATKRVLLSFTRFVPRNGTVEDDGAGPYEPREPGALNERPDGAPVTEGAAAGETTPERSGKRRRGRRGGRGRRRGGADAAPADDTSS